MKILDFLPVKIKLIYQNKEIIRVINAHQVL